MPREAKPVVVQLAQRYPTLFLPFDLDGLTAVAEDALRGSASGYKSHEFPKAIYRSSFSFAVYQYFHFLTVYPNKLSAKIDGLKSVLEVGTGLGVISFVLSQLLPKAKISGLEIDQALVDWQYRIRKLLSSVFGYNVSNTKFYRGDILGEIEHVGLGDFDAVIGCFPLGHNVSNRELIAVFQKLKKGALFFHLFSKVPLPPSKESERFGFRKIPIEADPPVMMNVYERI